MIWSSSTHTHWTGKESKLLLRVSIALDTVFRSNLPVLCSWYRKSRHWVFGAVELFNNSDPSHCVCSFEVYQVGRCTDTCSLEPRTDFSAYAQSFIWMGAVEECYDSMAKDLLIHLLWWNSSVAKVMQLVLQSLQRSWGFQEMLGQDLLLLTGVSCNCDGIPDLNQDSLWEETWGELMDLEVHHRRDLVFRLVLSFIPSVLRSTICRTTKLEHVYVWFLHKYVVCIHGAQRLKHSWVWETLHTSL